MVAQRIRTFPEGQFSPSPPPQVLRRLTDDLLVTASDAVKGVAACTVLYVLRVEYG